MKKIIFILLFISSLIYAKDNEENYDKYIQQYLNMKNNVKDFYFLDIKDMYINLLTDSRPTYLITDFVINVSKKEHLEILKKIKPIIRDMAIEIYSSKTPEELLFQKGRKYAQIELSIVISNFLKKIINDKDENIIPIIYFQRFIFVDSNSIVL